MALPGLAMATRQIAVFPDEAAVLRLVGVFLAVLDDEWPEGWRCLRPETMAAIEPSPNRWRWSRPLPLRRRDQAQRRVA